jgi:AbrB family looped-hinge helix DNA binding protein
MTSSHSLSSHSRVKVDSAGRIVIPSDLRAKLGIEPGQELILHEETDALRLQTFHQALARAQSFFSKFARPGESIVDELIRDRREEAAKEDRE